MAELNALARDVWVGAAIRNYQQSVARWDSFSDAFKEQTVPDPKPHPRTSVVVDAAHDAQTAEPTRMGVLHNATPPCGEDGPSAVCVSSNAPFINAHGPPGFESIINQTPRTFTDDGWKVNIRRLDANIKSTASMRTLDIVMNQLGLPASHEHSRVYALLKHTSQDKTPPPWQGNQRRSLSTSTCTTTDVSDAPLWAAMALQRAANDQPDPTGFLALCRSKKEANTLMKRLDQFLQKDGHEANGSLAGVNTDGTGGWAVVYAAAEKKKECSVFDEEVRWLESQATAIGINKGKFLMGWR